MLPSAVAPNFDMDLYLASHEKLRKLASSFLVYAHRGVEREPDRAIEEGKANTILFVILLLLPRQRVSSPNRLFREYVITLYPELAATLSGQILIVL